MRTFKFVFGEKEVWVAWASYLHLVSKVGTILQQG